MRLSVGWDSVSYRCSTGCGATTRVDAGVRVARGVGTMRSRGPRPLRSSLRLDGAPAHVGPCWSHAGRGRTAAGRAGGRVAAAAPAELGPLLDRVRALAGDRARFVGAGPQGRAGWLVGLLQLRDAVDAALLTALAVRRHHRPRPTRPRQRDPRPRPHHPPVQPRPTPRPRPPRHRLPLPRLPPTPPPHRRPPPHPLDRRRRNHPPQRRPALPPPPPTNPRRRLDHPPDDTTTGANTRLWFTGPPGQHLPSDPRGP